MALLHRFTAYPTLGNEDELRAVLERQIEQDKQAGMRIGFGAAILDPDAPSIFWMLYHEDGAGLERQTQRRQTDPAYRDFWTRVSALCRMPVSETMTRVLIPWPDLGATRWTSRMIIYPRPGAEADVENLLNERVRALQAAGVGCQSSYQLLSATGDAYTLAVRHADVDGFTTYSRSHQTDPDAAAFARRMAELSRAPFKWDLSETLVALHHW